MDDLLKSGQENNGGTPPNPPPEIPTPQPVQMNDAKSQVSIPENENMTELVNNLINSSSSTKNSNTSDDSNLNNNQASTTNSPPKQKKKSSSILVIIGVLLLLIVIPAIYLVTQQKNIITDIQRKTESQVVNNNSQQVVLSPAPTFQAAPTNSTAGPQCQRIKIYKDNILVDPAILKPSDFIIIGVTGVSATKARLRINGSPWTETSSQNSSGEYTVTFTIPDDVSNFTLEAEVYKDGQWN
jgi:hypothetical protein